MVAKRSNRAGAGATGYLAPAIRTAIGTPPTIVDQAGSADSRVASQRGGDLPLGRRARAGDRGDRRPARGARRLGRAYLFGQAGVVRAVRHHRWGARHYHRDLTAGLVATHPLGELTERGPVYL